MAWNDERVELLKKLHADGLSNSHMARVISTRVAPELGPVSRNAVIGKVHRLGLATRPIARTSQAQSRGGRKAARVRPMSRPVGNPALRELYLKPEPFVAGPELVIPLAERKTIQTLNDGDCRWPIGSPGEDGFHFCGRQQVQGLPYCSHHSLRAYAPPQPSRRHRADTAAPAPAKETQDA